MRGRRSSATRFAPDGGEPACSTAPAIFRIPGLRRYPLIRALEFLGGAALIVRFAEALRDWERTDEGPLTIDLS